MITRTLTSISPSVLDIAAALRSLIRTMLALACIAAVVLIVLAVRYMAFEYTRGGQPIVPHLPGLIAS
jgi:hypothetical protein